ncbi:phosphohydrolase [Pseudomonas sp. 32.2.56]|uniref:phosphohydrolase n=1 Tax=Pseudomonas sp. 32.2.56 TaxID=2969303 RepID=UPI00214FCBAF|nr:phosphohydrolase [Pseudomonas sp. 32.2.56]MCR4508897.1 phosphohydrolase [Pseudomonas sp. 32.2.56]
MTWILTRSGKRMDLFDPKPAMVDPADIAHALSMLCRFNGHTSSFYSVAQHSCIVADLVPRELELAALLHDATEAYVGDMVRPLKQHPSMHDYREIEYGIWIAICDRFAIDYTLPQAVHKADMIALATERRDLMPNHPEEWECLRGVEPRPEPIKALLPSEASIHYFNRLLQLMATTHRTAAA